MADNDITGKLKSIGQTSVLRFINQLDAAGKRRLMGQLEAQDLDSLSALSEEYVKNKPLVELPGDIQPVKAFPRVADAANRGMYQDAEKLGRALLSQGKIAAFLVAGGQGTRLGYDGPKGEYPVTPIKSKPLFQVFAEQLRNHAHTFGKVVPWYIMTSDINDGPTRAFFEKNNYFGLYPSDVLLPAAGNDAGIFTGRADSAGRERFARAQPRRTWGQPAGAVSQRRDCRHAQTRRGTSFLFPG